METPISWISQPCLMERLWQPKMSEIWHSPVYPRFVGNFTHHAQWLLLWSRDILSLVGSTMLAKIAKLVQLQELGFMVDITTVRWTYEATNATREAHRVDRPPRFTRLLYAPPRRCGYSPMDCQKNCRSSAIPEWSQQVPRSKSRFCMDIYWETRHRN